MIKTIKNTIKEIYYWIKDKVIRFKKWLILIICGAVVVAAPLVIPDDPVKLPNMIENDLVRVNQSIVFNYLLRENETDIEIISKRTENSKTFETGKPNQFRLGVKIGAVHYKENYDSDEDWKDIDTNHKVDKGNYWMYEKMPIKVKIFKNKVGYEIESRRSGHKVLVELDGTPPNKNDVDFEFDVQPNRVRLWKNIKHANAPKKFRWKITETNKKTGLNSLKFREKPEAFDADKKEIDIAVKKNKIDDNSFYWEEKFTDKGEKYPIKIDTDVDEQVGTNNDDGNVSYGDTDFYSKTTFNEIIGKGTYKNRTHNTWHRFPGISGLSGATINTAYISLYGSAAKQGTPLTTIYADDQVSPSYPFSISDYSGRSVTSASVNWDDEGLSTSAFTNSPSIISVIQELANSYDPTAIQILHKGDRSSAGDNNMRSRSHDSDPAKAAKLFITYTAGGGAERRMFLVE